MPMGLTVFNALYFCLSSGSLSLQFGKSIALIFDRNPLTLAEVYAFPLT